MIPEGIYVDDRSRHQPDEMPLVLVHGAPDRSKNFRAVVDLLDDLPVVIYDRRGYGKSVSAGPATGFADHADDLIAILDGRRSVVVAQSVGTHVAMKAATVAPDLVAALGLWEPPVAWAAWWPTSDLRESATRYAAQTDTMALAEEFNRWILGDERWESLAEPTKAMLLQEGRAFRTDMASELVEAYSFDDLTMPCVIGCGTETTSGHLEGGRRFAALLGAELYEVEGADHFAPLSSPHVWATLARRAYSRAI